MGSGLGKTDLVRRAVVVVGAEFVASVAGLVDTVDAGMIVDYAAAAADFVANSVVEAAFGRTAVLLYRPAADAAVASALDA